MLLPAGEFEEESKQPALAEQQKHQLKHRELFLSRQFESLPATHIRYVDGRRLPQMDLICPPDQPPQTRPLPPILLTTDVSDVSLAFLHRGKCNVTLLNETDMLAGYLDKEVSHLTRTLFASLTLKRLTPSAPPPGLLLLLVGVRPRTEDSAGRPGRDPGGLQVPGRDPRQAG